MNDKTNRIAWTLALAGVACVALLGCSSGGRGARSARDATDADAAPAESVDSRKGEFAGPQTAGRDRMADITEEEMRARREAERLESQLRDVFFPFDKADLTQESREVLLQDARLLRDNASVRVFLEGHCDERGTNEYNLALGERRSRSVRDYLVQSGVSADRLTVLSYGEERPFALGHDESAWSQNRRTHFRVRTSY